VKLRRVSFSFLLLGLLGSLLVILGGVAQRSSFFLLVGVFLSGCCGLAMLLLSDFFGGE
jgi:hypothetical protein